jgi:hypothetical protein
MSIVRIFEQEIQLVILLQNPDNFKKGKRKKINEKLVIFLPSTQIKTARF